MPAIKTSIISKRKERMITLHERMQHENFEAKEIAEEFHVSLSTIQRDIKYMKENPMWWRE